MRIAGFVFVGAGRVMSRVVWVIAGITGIASGRGTDESAKDLYRAKDEYRP